MSHDWTLGVLSSAMNMPEVVCRGGDKIERCFPESPVMTHFTREWWIMTSGWSSS